MSAFLPGTYSRMARKETLGALRWYHYAHEPIPAIWINHPSVSGGQWCPDCRSPDAPEAAGQRSGLWGIWESPF